MLALARHPNIVAVKDCSGDTDHLQAVLADGRLAVYGGDDHRLFPWLCMGATGAVCASAHLATAGFVALAQAVDAGDLGLARQWWRQLHPLTVALFAEPSPGPIKAALASRHALSPALRLPMTEPSDEARERVEAALAALQG